MRFKMLREPIDIKSMTTEILSPEKYLTLSAKERANIFQAKIVPPVLGSEDFGKIQVDYKTPVYKISNE